jgi:aminopeptidase YwaD
MRKGKQMKSLNRLVAFIIVAALALNAFAQEPVPTNVPNVGRLRTHIEYLASDKLEGRRTGSSGANSAAEYIAREFSRYGLRRSIGRDLPGMSILEADSPKRYLQEFPYVAGVELGKGNSLSASVPNAGAAMSLRIGDDWMPLGFSTNTPLMKASPTFVGYGITASELNYDDYVETNVRGKIAIALSGTPDGENPHGKFVRFEDARWKAIAARNAGASALIVIAHQEPFKEDRLSTLRYDNSAADAGIPVVVVSRTFGAKLLGMEGMEVLSRAENTMAAWVLGGGPAGNCKTPCGVTHNFKFDLNWTLNLSTEVIRREVTAANVAGILDGSDPTLKNETIVIGAHYDHLGRGGEGSLAPKQGDIHHGADDNASGVAGVLELARIFSQQQPRPRRTIVFMAFSGEEEGLLGSNYYVNHPIVPLANTVAMINMDMIGRMKDNKLIVGGVGTTEGWRQVIASANSGERMRVAATPETSGEIARTSTSSTSSNSGMSGSVPMVTGINGRPIVTRALDKTFNLSLSEDGFGPSDHSSFYAKQIPVLFFWTGSHEDYHKPSDTADKINYDDEARILSLVSRVIHDIDSNDKRPAYTVAKSESTGRSMGFRVYLGTIPNYADSTDGLLLDGVREDSPAAKAGLKAGDKIVKLAGRDVRNVYDYTAALGEMKAGQEYEVELMRGGERIKLTITPAARKYIKSDR